MRLPCRQLIETVLLSIAMFGAPRALPAQAWKQVGTTSSGNPVFVDPKSVKKSGNLVNATVRVVFKTPVTSAKGRWASSKTIGSFDCAKRSLAAKENVFYADAKGTRITERNVNKMPGFGPALGGSLGAVALDYLCHRSQ